MAVLMAPAEVVQALLCHYSLYTFIYEFFFYYYLLKKKENILTHRAFFVALNKMAAYPSHLLKFQQMPIHQLDNDINDLTGDMTCIDLVMLFSSCGVRSLSCFQHPCLEEDD